MRTLYTLAFPLLADADRQWIERLRAQHDPQSARVAVHFTLVFGAALPDETAYLGHVQAATAAVAPLRFSCRWAMLAADHTGTLAQVWLVPDDGFAALSRLHDALYRGPLAPALRLDIPFVPHLTIAALADRAAAKALCDALNADGVAVDGRIETLSVCTADADHVRPIGEFPLRPL